MKTTGLIALLVTTAAAVVAAVLVSSGGRGAGPDPQADALVLPELRQKLDGVARITLQRAGVKTTLLRQGDHWVVEEKGGYPADGAKVRQALAGLAELRYVEPKTRKPELYPRLEVEDVGQKDAKSTLVTVSDDKNEVIGEIIAGKFRVDALGGNTDGVYLRKPDDKQSWLARGTLDLSGDTAAWLDRSIVDIPREQVKEVVLTGPDGSTLDIAHDKAEDPLALKGAPAEAKPKSDSALVEPTTVLASLTLSDVRPLAELPVPADGVAHADVTGFDGLTLKLALFDKDGKSWVHIEAAGSGDAEKKAADLNAKLAPWIYAIPDYKAKALRTKLADVTAAPKPS